MQKINKRIDSLEQLVMSIYKDLTSKIQEWMQKNSDIIQKYKYSTQKTFDEICFNINELKYWKNHMLGNPYSPSFPSPNFPLTSLLETHAPAQNEAILQSIDKDSQSK